jgi:hypothetical protein
MRKRGEQPFSDERILGSGEFVEEVLRKASEAQKEMVPMRLRQADTDEMRERASAENGLSVAALQAVSRNGEYSAIKRVHAGKFVHEWGLSHADVVRKLGISRAGVSMLVRR